MINHKISENALFVCQSDWLLTSLLDCETEDERLDYLWMLYEYSIGNYEYEPEIRNNYKIGRSIKVTIKHNSDKRQAIIEKRRQAGLANAERLKNIKSIENQAFANHLLSNDNNNVNVNVNDNVNVSKDIKENLLKENEEEKIFFSLKDCLRLFDLWHELPEPEGRKLAYHCIYPEAVEECRRIAGLPMESDRADAIRRLDADVQHKARIPVSWETWRGMWKACELMTKYKFKPVHCYQIVQTFDELNTKGLQDFYTRFAEQLEYAGRQDNILNIEKLLKVKFKDELNA